MKKILLGLVLLLVVLIGVVVIVPQFIPTETYKNLATEQVKNATGRDLDIRGKVSISVLPRLAVELNDVTFSNAPGSKEKHMVKLSQLALNLKLLPLLSGEVEIATFVLRDPTIFLEVDKNGRPNWEFQTASKPATKAPPQKAPAPDKTAPKPQTGGSGIALPVSDIRLGEVGIRNGTIVYSNAKTGEQHKLSQVNLTVSLSSLNSPFSAKGEVTWKEKKVVLETRAGSLRSVMEGKKTNVSVKIASEPLNVDFQGTTALKPSMTVAGKWAVNVPSVRNLASWAGAPLNMKGEGFGLFEVKGNITAQPDQVSLQDVDIQFDKIKGKAKTTVRLGTPRPSIKGALQLESLDLNPYLPEKKSAEKESTKTKTPAPSPSKPAPSESKPAGPPWSDEPIDMSGLQLVDADLSFQAKEIIYEKIKIGQSAVTLKLKGGRLALDLSRLELYKGNGQLKVSLDSVANPPSLTKQVKLSGVETLPLMTDAADMKFLSGKANAEFSVKTRGKSQLQLVKALNGTGKVQFLDGAIEGVNLGSMFRNIKSAFLDPKAKESRKTDFSELSATFQIQNGLMRTNDLSMKSPLLRLSGKGVISLPPKTMDMRLEPKVVLTSKGQGGAADAAGLKVPVVVKGPWDNLSYKPDIGGIVESVTKDPDAVKGLIEGVIKGDKDSKKKLKDTIKGLFR